MNNLLLTYQRSPKLKATVYIEGDPVPVFDYDLSMGLNPSVNTMVACEGFLQPQAVVCRPSF